MYKKILFFIKLLNHVCGIEIYCIFENCKSFIFQLTFSLADGSALKVKLNDFLPKIDIIDSDIPILLSDFS